VVGRDRDTVGNLIDDVKLLNGDLVDFVEHKNARDVDPVETGTELVNAQRPSVLAV